VGYDLAQRARDIATIDLRRELRCTQRVLLRAVVHASLGQVAIDSPAPQTHAQTHASPPRLTGYPRVVCRLVCVRVSAHVCLLFVGLSRHPEDAPGVRASRVSSAYVGSLYARGGAIHAVLDVPASSSGPSPFVSVSKGPIGCAFFCLGSKLRRSDYAARARSACRSRTSSTRRSVCTQPSSRSA
jgi:hypothetical protein